MDDRLRQRIGENMRRERRRAGLSQEQLARLADLHRTEIGLLEGGLRMPRIDTLLKIAGSIEVGPDKLLEGVEWQPGRSQPGSFALPSRMDLAASRSRGRPA